MNDTNAKPMTAATSREPRRAGMGSATGRNAPTTQATWNRASNRANVRPWLASGASRCTRESKASLPTAEVRATPPARIVKPSSPPLIPATRAESTPSASDPSSIISSTTLRRSIGATCTPTKADRPAAATTTAKCQAGAPGSPTMSMPRADATEPPRAAPGALTSSPSSPPRSSKASMKVTKPTAPRSRAMADADSRIVAARRADRSSEVAGARATGMRGSGTASTRASPYPTAAAPAAHAGLPTKAKAAPTLAPNRLITALISASRLLARTRLSSEGTYRGTTALLATA